MLNFDANPIDSDIKLQSYDQFINAENNKKQNNLTSFFANISKTICDIQLIHLDHVTSHLTMSSAPQTLAVILTHRDCLQEFRHEDHFFSLSASILCNTFVQKDE